MKKCLPCRNWFDSIGLECWRIIFVCWREKKKLYTNVLYPRFKSQGINNSVHLKMHVASYCFIRVCSNIPVILIKYFFLLCHCVSVTFLRFRYIWILTTVFSVYWAGLIFFGKTIFFRCRFERNAFLSLIFFGIYFIYFMPLERIQKHTAKSRISFWAPKLQHFRHFYIPQ